MNEIEKLRAELHAEIDRRIDAVAQQAADVEPPVCSDTLLALLAHDGPDGEKAASEIRYLRAELARLREGLKVQFEDFNTRIIRGLADNNGIALASSPREIIQCLAREIQRHRALVKS